MINHLRLGNIISELKSTENICLIIDIWQQTNACFPRFDRTLYFELEIELYHASLLQVQMKKKKQKKKKNKQQQQQKQLIKFNRSMKKPYIVSK